MKSREEIAAILVNAYPDAGLDELADMINEWRAQEIREKVKAARNGDAGLVLPSLLLADSAGLPN